MKCIKEDIHQMEEEMNGALEYMQMAVNIKQDDADWARKLYDMACAEYAHAMTWHEKAVADINATKEAHPSLSSDLMEVMAGKWEDEHAEAMEDASRFKALQMLYKEMI